MGWADPETFVAGVIGDPIGHSLSPAIHGAWLAQSEIPGVYGAYETRAEDFPGFVRKLASSGTVNGFNITSPYKEAALALADTADAAAQAAGAANLLLFRSGGSIEARNTDGQGLLAALSQQAPALRLRGAVAVILGAGGAARSAAVTLRKGGATVRIANRTTARAEALALEVDATPFGWRELRRALAGADLLINATTLGLDGGEPLDVPLEALPSGAVVMDMIYRPLRTRLLAQAEARGNVTVDGLAMLIGQAIPSFEALFGRRRPKWTSER